MIAAALVAFMQGGFLLLESGMVRSKNSINVAQKNISDFILSIIVFYLIGFMFMFGTSADGWIGWDSELIFWDKVEDWHYTFFVFQAVFVGTASTILSVLSQNACAMQPICQWSYFWQPLFIPSLAIGVGAIY